MRAPISAKSNASEAGSYLGSQTFVSLNSRLESNKAEEDEEQQQSRDETCVSVLP
jgi:hypothetical protein